jgi:hypothetical protein
MNNRSIYFDTLYPFQDRVLDILKHVDTGFYLSGGTAASRGYLSHRFSDTLDFFINDDDHFTLWVERMIQSMVAQQDWQCQVLSKEERFARLILLKDSFGMKIECINDVPAHIGEIRDHPILGRLDSPENILANKITALLAREEPKDLADIWGFCCQMGLSIQNALIDADSKAAGIFPADLARVLCSASLDDWRAIRWISPPPSQHFLEQLNDLGEKLLLPS